MKKKVRKYVDTRLYNVSHLFFAKNVILELIKKLKNVLRNENKSIAVHQKKIKLNKKGRSASAIMITDSDLSV